MADDEHDNRVIRFTKEEIDPPATDPNPRNVARAVAHEIAVLLSDRDVQTCREELITHCSVIIENAADTQRCAAQIVRLNAILNEVDIVRMERQVAEIERTNAELRGERPKPPRRPC